ncbi:hypothetical protein PRUB_b1120 [Pseudoalteromonas rubra]|uniref:Uncharacterized protein n=1 Tax=Pseudoalteromonas rubra TaxID=43658 RepID=A0A8T0C1K9_9GAMM|nr:hypothetical protein [Pseudoalteromonas rubra]KAF7781790.1 hypothetical protein PRUB_b1120 [Pseudoalteromonas rubra]
MTNTTEQEVSNAEQQAMQAVAQADADTAAQSTGYTTSTPEQAEQVATNAVIAADQSVAQQAFTPPSAVTPEEAEREATQAVAATE